jgi:hypothetical protein
MHDSLPQREGGRKTSEISQRWLIPENKTGCVLLNSSDTNSLRYYAINAYIASNVFLLCQNLVIGS